MCLTQKIVTFCCLMLLMTAAFPARIKDITTLAGVRENQLVGYGLVVGLDGTGDKTNQVPFTNQTFQNMLLAFGIHIPVNAATQLKNVAAVAISTNLPPFARIGQKIDITVSSLGNATSLRGGNLLMAPLKGADGKVYAIAQGNVVVSGFGAQGADGSKVTVNSIATGSIPDGATVENVINMPFVQNGIITFELSQPDFTTAIRVEEAINKNFGSKVARAQDPGAVSVKIGHMINETNYRALGYKGEMTVQPNEEAEKRRYVPLIARIENIELNPAEIAARVIVNSRTGTIVIGRNVTIAPVAVSHGNLSVIITERPYVSQPQGFSRGRTVTGSASDISVNQQANRAFVFAPGPSLNDVVEAINRVGAAPGDLIAILEAIKAAGALNAELNVI